MTRKLLEQAFEKAEIAIGKESVNARAVHLAEVVSEDYNYPITAKSISRYFHGKNNPKKEVLDALARYLGYDSYEAFVLEQAETPSEKKKPGERKSIFDQNRRRKKTILMAFFLLVVGSSSYYALVQGKEDCIVWNGDHYEAVSCSGAALERPFNGYLLENFRKVEVSDTTTFFRKGKVTIWYDKSNKQLEYFTAPGLHPVNGKTLKPMSRYMINKYVK